MLTYFFNGEIESIWKKGTLCLNNAFFIGKSTKFAAMFDQLNKSIDHIISIDPFLLHIQHLTDIDDAEDIKLKDD